MEDSIFIDSERIISDYEPDTDTTDSNHDSEKLSTKTDDSFSEPEMEERNIIIPKKMLIPATFVAIYSVCYETSLVAPFLLIGMVYYGTKDYFYR